MPYGTCQGDYSCDFCKVSLPRDTLAWIDLKKRKLYCMFCKPEEALKEDKPCLTPTKKKICVLQVLLKIYKKRNKILKQELAQSKRRRAS